MSELTGKQKRRLKAVGQRLPDDVTVGRQGLTEGVRRRIEALLEDRELIKVRMAADPLADRKQSARTLAEEVKAELVNVVGWTCLLYRESTTLPREQRLRLE